MAEPTQEEAEHFLAVTGELLTLVIADDLDGVEKLRDSLEVDWWNVALTLAYLVRDVFSGKPEALAIIGQTFVDARSYPQGGETAESETPREAGFLGGGPDDAETTGGNEAIQAQMAYDELRAKLMAIEDKERGEGATPEMIHVAELALGGPFPEDYKRFLVDFGWLSVGHYEFYGLGNDVPQHLDVLRETVVERTVFEPHLREHLVTVHNDGAGNQICFDTRAVERSGSSPLFFWAHDDQLGREQTPDVWSPSFSAYVLGCLKSLEEDEA